MNILLVLPDRTISGFLEVGLTDAGYRVEVVRTVAEAGQRVRVNGHSVVIIDVLGSTELIGRVARGLERAQKKTPILALAAPDEIEGDEVRSQVDAYLTKPFKFEELLRRLHSLEVAVDERSRRQSPSPQTHSAPSP